MEEESDYEEYEEVFDPSESVFGSEAQAIELA